jgi:hypothetical protein
VNFEVDVKIAGDNLGTGLVLGWRLGLSVSVSVSKGSYSSSEDR